MRLKETGLVTQNVLDQAQNKLQAAQQTLRGAEARLTSSSAKEREAVISKNDASLVVQDLKILEAALERAKAQTERQKVIIEKHQVRSPINGVVDEMFFDAGERTLAGFRAALLHDPQKVWVSANIKETQVRYVKVGAPANIKVDSAPGAGVTGRVSVIHDLTVAEAALMPNPNATGVFTKITHRPIAGSSCLACFADRYRPCSQRRRSMSLCHPSSAHSAWGRIKPNGCPRHFLLPQRLRCWRTHGR